MQDDLLSKRDRIIDDLVRQPHGSPSKVQVSPGDVEEKLKVKMHDIDERKKEEATKQAAEQAGAGYIFLKEFPVSHEALALVPEEEARRLQAVCFLKTDTEVRIGAVNPLDEGVALLLQKIEDETRTHGDIYQISEASLQAVLKLYASLPKLRKYVSGIEISGDDLSRFQGTIGSFKELHEKLQHVSTTDTVTMIMAGAIKSRASDVHIEIESDQIKVRFRIDGVLYDVATLPKAGYQKIVNRLKLIAKLKINVTNIPQDGRYTIYLSDGFIDVRVSTVPSVYGESIVMRLLMSSATALELKDIGLVGEPYEIVEKEIERPNGMILATGPTGSGKTTTLYAFIKRLNKPEIKVITLENPIEYRINGITQTQVETTEQAEDSPSDLKKLLTSTQGGKRHFTFASGLKSVLRQDPDIVMVGEVRDKETAEIAIQAALTGHLLLSTLHTNSAAGAIPRLLSMEVKPFLLAPALNMIIGQRLVRRVCASCKEEYAPPAGELAKVREVIASIPPEKRSNLDEQNLKFYRGRGCQACSGIGFKGRVGIFEILTMNEEIEKLILGGQVSEYQIQAIAKKHGMLTMLQDGILKALQGVTMASEIFRTTD